ncbi:hypothetical protein CNY67_03425 [Desulfovibrio sp. G11]|nr:hypothetical protein CNY67_03425 [Desulfovibrio sp. G11]
MMGRNVFRHTQIFVKICTEMPQGGMPCAGIAAWNQSRAFSRWECSGGGAGNVRCEGAGATVRKKDGLPLFGLSAISLAA